MLQLHSVNAVVALYQCKSATSSMRKWHFIGAKLLRKPHVFGFLHQQLHEWLTLVSHTIVEHSVLQILLQLTHLPAWRQVEHLHNLVAVDDGLQQTLVVALL